MWRQSSRVDGQVLQAVSCLRRGLQLARPGHESAGQTTQLGIVTPPKSAERGLSAAAWGGLQGLDRAVRTMIATPMVESGRPSLSTKLVAIADTSTRISSS